MNIQIQQMTKEDILPSLNLEKTHNTHILSENIILEDLKSENNYYLVAKLDNEIVGYIGISYILDSADVISIVTDKKYAHQGIASLLLENIFTFLKKKQVERILLEVRKSNIPAQNLYLKHRFKQISIRKNYYDNIEDALIFEKPL